MLEHMSTQPPQATAIQPMEPAMHSYRHLISRASLSLMLGATLALTGCGLAPSGTANTNSGGTLATAKYSGSVFGGQQPISGTTVQLYTVGTGGLGSAAQAIGTPVVTDAGGNFSLTGTYNCAGATQLYILASGGNPGTGSNNNAIVEAAALGSCASLLANANTTFLSINELTTVAAAYALAPFATDSLHIGATGSNPTGLVNAIASAQALVNIPTGTVGGSSLPTSAVLPVAEINTLADIIAACVNSGASTTSACQSISTATGASNTFDALIAIAKNPGSTAATALFTIIPGMSPFQPTLSTQPNDFSLAVSYNASGTLAAPFAIAIDASGNAWITNAAGTSVTELSSQGSVSSTNTVAGLAGAQGVAIDKLGNVWVANSSGNSLIKLTLSGGSVTGTSTFTTGGLSGPTALAIDSANNVFVANLNGSSVSGYSASGTPLAGSPFTPSGLTMPTGVAIGSDGSVYVASGSGAAIKLAGANQASPGSYLTTLTDNRLQGATSLAIDSAGDILLTGSTTGTSVAGAISEFSAAGSAKLTAPLQAGIATPSAAAFDGSGFWVTNGSSSGSLAKLTYGSSSASSPASGLGSLNQPQGIAIDSTGSIWTTNAGDNTVSRFIGLAQPVATPIANSVGP